MHDLNEIFKLFVLFFPGFELFEFFRIGKVIEEGLFSNVWLEVSEEIAHGFHVDIIV